MYFLLFLFVVAFNDRSRRRVVEHDFREHFNNVFSTRHLKYTNSDIYGVMYSFFFFFIVFASNENNVRTNEPMDVCSRCCHVFSFRTVFDRLFFFSRNDVLFPTRQSRTTRRATEKNLFLSIRHKNTLQNNNRRRHDPMCQRRQRE